LDHLHVHDNDGKSDDHLAPGAGTIPWREVLAALDAANFSGYAALELRDSSRGHAGCGATLTRSLTDVAAFQQQLGLGVPPSSDAGAKV